MDVPDHMHAWKPLILWHDVLLSGPMHLEQGGETQLDWPVEYCFSNFSTQKIEIAEMFW